MDWKHDLYRKVAPHIGADAIFASNTSGLSITRLSEGFDAGLQKRFCGVHFFNPPRYMHLVELIPTAQTDPAVLDRLETFLTSTMGKGVVRAKDTPNFIGNRIGIFSILATFKEVENFGLTYDVVDDLTGDKLGRAKSGTFRTADVVGLDTMAHVIRTMQENIKDSFAAVYETPPVLKALIDKGALGAKTGAGFYRKVGKDILRLDPTKADYVPSGAKADDTVARILKKKTWAERIRLLRESKNPQALFVWAILRNTFHYAALALEEIADTARDVDFAMRWGFGQKQGPFEIWQQAGWRDVAQWIGEDIEAGKALSKTPLPRWVGEGPVADKGGVHQPEGSWSPSRGEFVPRSDLPVYRRQLFRAPLQGEAVAPAGETVFEDDSIRLWSLQQAGVDRVLIASPKTKMNAIGPEEKKLQDVMLALRYAQVPTVAAVSGLALGGGCELALYCARRVANIESYIGLVEVGVGLIPGGGGLAYGARRAAEEQLAAPEAYLLHFLGKYFMNAGTAAVSKSAIEARHMGYLLPSDPIVFNAHELLYAAVREAKAMFDAGHRAPPKARFRVAGRDGLATIQAQLVNMRDGGFISAHDFHLGRTIASVMCGGDVDAGSVVDEAWILGLEREGFVSLLEHPKTQERIMGMMQTGKPVRN